MDKELSLEEYSERYIKPVVKSDPIRCMVLLRECGYWVCKNCGNWVASENKDWEGYGDCEQAVYDLFVTEDRPYMVYSDYEGYGALFLTHEDFGCILFRERGDEDG